MFPSDRTMALGSTQPLVKMSIARAERDGIRTETRFGRVHLNRWGRQFSRLLAAEVCASA